MLHVRTSSSTAPLSSRMARRLKTGSGGAESAAIRSDSVAGVGVIATDANDRKLIAGAIALADRLGNSVTAEGVKSQGQLYSPALPIDWFAELLRDRR